MEFIDILKKRRSVRAFEQREVSRDLIKDLIKVAQLSPVSCNLQLTQYVVVDDKDLLSKLAHDVSYKFKYAPVVIVVLVDSRFTVERKSAITGAGMAVENMILRAVDLGLSTCPMAGFEKDDVIRNILDIPKHMEINLLLAVGYQDESVQKEKISRLDPEKVFSFNTYGNLRTINSSTKLSDHTPKSIIDYRSRIAPVYLDRFRLSSFNEKYYKTILNAIENILPKNTNGNWLDLMSYDGEFIKIIHEGDLKNRYKFWASDYILGSISFLKKRFKSESLQIDTENNIDTNEKFDVISFITQLDFTPESEKLLKSATTLLNKNGYIFIAVIRNTWYKRVILFIKKLPRYFKGKHNNIYEGNTFYKIGPYSYKNLNKTTTFLSGLGLNLSEDKSFNFYRNGVIVRLLAFKK